MRCTTYEEELAVYAAGELAEDAQERIVRHLDGCPDCRTRVETLRRVDDALASLEHAVPRTEAVMATRRAVTDAKERDEVPEIMTLEEVARALRLSPEQLADIVDELPAFELAGQVRVRRKTLTAWVEERERAYKREADTERLSRESVLMFEKGVA